MSCYRLLLSWSFSLKVIHFALMRGYLHPSVIALLVLVGTVTFGIVAMLIFTQPSYLQTALVGESLEIIEEPASCEPPPSGEGWEFDDEGFALGLSTSQQQQQVRPRPTIPANPPYCECLCGIFPDRQDPERLAALLCPYPNTLQDPTTRYYYCTNNWFHRQLSTVTEEGCYDLEQQRATCRGNYLYGRIINNTLYQCKQGYKNARLFSCVWVSEGATAPEQEG